MSHTLSRLNSFVILMLAMTASSLSSEPITGHAFGTTYQIKLGETITTEIEKQIRDEIDCELKRIEAIFSLYNVESELSRWNATLSNDWAPIALEVVQLVNAAEIFWKESQGSFDPTILPVSRQWDLESLRPDWSPPNKRQIRDALKNVGFQHLEVRKTPPKIRRIQKNIQLDLNALVEGWALDRMTELLENRGIDNFLMELGGDFISRGRPSSGQNWRVSIENPAAPRETPLQVELFNQALCTSGNYRNGRDFEGKWYSHTIDAMTGYPSNFNLSLTSVVANTALEADGWATTLQVSPPSRWQNLANSNRIAAVRIQRIGENLEISRSTIGETLFVSQSKISHQPNHSDRENPFWGAILFVVLVASLLFYSVVRYSVSWKR